MVKSLKPKMLPPQLTNEELVELLLLNEDLNKNIRKLEKIVHSRNEISMEGPAIFRMKEAVESTRIEGTQASMTDVYESNANNEKFKTRDIEEVINYMNALDLAFARVEQNGIIVGRTLKEIHKTLMQGNVRGRNKSPGEFRKISNWIGPEGAGREKASFIPPSPVELGDYIDNLERFINAPKDGVEKWPVIIRTAIMHAQFESIHPFLDGNGRVGRILIPAFFKMNGEEILSTLFISKELEESKIEYYHLLNGTRKEQPEWYNWIKYFIEATIRSTEGAIEQYNKMAKLFDSIKKKDDHSYNEVLYGLFKLPVATVNQLAKKTSLSTNTVRRVLNEMADSGYVIKGLQKRNIPYYFYPLLRIVQ